MHVHSEIESVTIEGHRRFDVRDDVSNRCHPAFLTYNVDIGRKRFAAAEGLRPPQLPTNCLPADGDILGLAKFGIQ